MSGLPSSLCESVPRGSRGTEYSSVVWAAGMPARSRSDQHAHVLFASYYNVQRHPLQAVLRRVRFGQYHGPCPERAFRAVCHLHFSVLFTSMVRCLLCSSLLLAYCVSSVPSFLSVHWRWRWHSIQAASIFSSMSPACSLSKEFCVTTHTSRHSRARIRHPSPLGLSCVSRAYIEISRIEGISRCLACARNGGIGGSVCVLILVHVLPFSVVHLALLSLSPDPQLIHTRIHALLGSKYHPHSHRTSAQEAH